MLSAASLVLCVSLQQGLTDITLTLVLRGKSCLC